MLRRGKRPTMGMMVEFSQMANSTMKWLPFMVTDVQDDDVVSGVALSGMPGPLGWNNRGRAAIPRCREGQRQSDVAVQARAPSQR